MRIPLTQPIDIGCLIRATRKAQNLRQDDAAGSIGVSDVFLGRLENGAPGARLDKALQVLNELGIVLYVDVSDNVSQKYLELKKKRNDTFHSNILKKR
ncbi:Helix-turn-helix domain-containing protein [Collimonas sp. OK307]|nr:Helix-turn-helix domain-containing protein [Collimonas sp. OK307]